MTTKYFVYVLTIVFSCCTFIEGNTQILIERTMIVKDSITKDKIPFPTLIYHTKDYPDKVNTILGNEHGLLDLSLIPIAAHLYYKITSPGYDTIEGDNETKQMYGFSIYLNQHPYNTLEQVTVSGGKRQITLAPNEIKFNWNKYMKDGTNSLAQTIKRLPFIINNSLSPNSVSLETIGKKKVKVFLDGRVLSEAEILSLPSLSIAKASLVTFPSAVETDDNSAILYLTTVNYSYSYKFQEISGNYDRGVSGPALTYRFTNKKGIWSNNIFVNAYHYKYPNSYTARSFNNLIFQNDTTKSNATVAILSATITRLGANGSLLTLGLSSNSIFSQSNSNAFNINDGALHTKSANNYFNASIFANYQWNTLKGDKFRISTLLDINPTNINSLDSKNAIENLHSRGVQTAYSGSASIKYISKNKQIQDWK